MRDIVGMMKKAKEMQEEIATLEVTGSSGADLVSITLNGQGNMKAIKIDTSLIKAEEIEILEDLIIAAHNEAKRKIETAITQKTQGLADGLSIPPGLKLPF
ncbi:MAG: hypothetical protein JSC188_000279 [Candidatus Tokpelaia sp. JSC188]|nr:MAG: hypothetical protein JSC188_000279 [Candidatus Tokpelaia sp. JSC188]